MQGFEVPPADNIKSSLPNFKRQTKPFAEWAAEYLRSWNEMKHTWYSKRHNHLIYLIPVCEIYGAPQWISFESKATVSTQRTLSNVPSSLPIRACISKEKTRSRHQSHRWLTCTRNLYTTWSLMLHLDLLGSSATRTSEVQYSTRQVYQQDMRDEAVVLLRTRMFVKKKTQFATILLLLKRVPQLIRTPYVDGFGSFWWCIAGHYFDLYTLIRCKFLDLFESRRAKIRQYHHKNRWINSA